MTRTTEAPRQPADPDRIIDGINYGPSYWPIRHEVVEKKYKAHYVGDFCLRTKGGGWSEEPVAVYFQAEPPEGYSPYLGIFLDRLSGSIMICSAASVAEGTWTGAVAKNGEIVFSRYRHDYRGSSDGSVVVDGGRDYFRGRAGHLVSLAMVDGRLRVVNPDAAVSPSGEPAA